jgi:hypothetical protein
LITQAASGSGKGIHIALEQRYLLCRYLAALRKRMRARLKLCIVAQLDLCGGLSQPVGAITPRSKTDPALLIARFPKYGQQSKEILNPVLLCNPPAIAGNIC